MPRSCSIRNGRAPAIVGTPSPAPDYLGQHLVRLTRVPIPVEGNIKLAIVELRAPMVASVFEITCHPGDHVSDGDELVILESMKLEIPVTAECSGKVAEIAVEKGSGD